LLVLTSTFPRWRGDSEPPFVFELSRRLADRFDVVVLAPHAPGAALSESMAGIEVQRFRYFSTTWQTLAYRGGILANLKQNRLRYLLVPFFLLAGFFATLRLLRGHRFDAIHAHWLIPNGLIAVMARATIRAPKPAVICTAHGSDLSSLKGPLFRWLQRLVISRADKLTVVSAALRGQVHALIPDIGVEAIPMGVDMEERFIPDTLAERSPNRLLFVGRLVEQKGVRHLIHAMRAIKRTHPQAVLDIIGEGPERALLEQLAETEEMRESIRFHGAVENAALPGWYAGAAVFVSPTLAEGFGLTLVEAMACGCAVVVSDLPAVRDIVRDGETGLLCPPGNSDALAKSICFLLDHSETRARMGKAGRESVRSRFDWSTVAERYAELIEGAVRGRA